jgi:hypothetical protein
MQVIFYPIISTTSTRGFSETLGLCRRAKPGLVKEAARVALSGFPHGFNETEDGKLLLPKTIPCQSKASVSLRLVSTRQPLLSISREGSGMARIGRCTLWH